MTCPKCQISTLELSPCDNYRPGTIFWPCPEVVIISDNYCNTGLDILLVILCPEKSLNVTYTEDQLIPVNTRIPEIFLDTRPGPESGPVPGPGKALTCTPFGWTYCKVELSGVFPWVPMDIKYGISKCVISQID